MKILDIIARVLLGLVYFVFGLNGFFNFIPAPPLEGVPAQVMGAFLATGYFFPVLKGVEVLGGSLLFFNRTSAFALVLLAPVTLHIVLFHAFLAPEGMYLQVVMLIIHVFLMWRRWPLYKPMFCSEACKN